MHDTTVALRSKYHDPSTYSLYGTQIPCVASIIENEFVGSRERRVRVRTSGAFDGDGVVRD